MKNIILSNFAALYGVHAPARLVRMYRKAGGPFSYFAMFWTTQNFAIYQADVTKRFRAVRLLLGVGMLLQIVLGLSLMYAGVVYDLAGALYFGLALIVSYPVVWAMVLFGLTLAWQCTRPKRFGKAVLCSLLEGQVKELRERNDFTVVAVAGSVGKTSTKLAIAELLATTKRVRYQQGNYNDRLTVPLVLFGVSQPGLYNIGAWLKIYLQNRRALRGPYPYDVVVVELGTDGPGQMKDFAYLRPELSVVTSVAAEHMEYFETMEAVAAEELTVFDYSTQVLVNTDDVDPKYLAKQSYVSYGTDKQAQYSVQLAGVPTKDGQKVTMDLHGTKLSVDSRYYGMQGAKIVLAAATVGHMLEMTNEALQTGLEQLRPFSGRMQVLPGIKDSLLLDDSYNANPLAVKAGLDVVYAMKTPQRIAILGSMNELGGVSPGAHTEVGAYCEPSKLDMVVTIGKDARKYLAPAAKERGCNVTSFDSPYDAGKFVKSQLKESAVVFVKGSQNGVFAEESLKQLLTNPDDANRLVRQNDSWMRVKKSQFGSGV